MSVLPQSINNLIDELSHLPGIGPKSAARLTFYLLTKKTSDVERLGQSIINLHADLLTCSRCFNYSNSDPCPICSDQRRRQNIIAVVEEPLDIMALEKTGFDGVYHVLGGVISPVNGIGPDELRIQQLIKRVKNEPGVIGEIILATDPSLEGEATAMYIRQQLTPYAIKTTRLARGLPVGGDLEYADEATLTRALEGRKDY